jgi:hypothetical protein
VSLGDREEIPCCVWQPPLGPAPVFVGPCHGVALIEGDAIFILTGSGNSVNYSTGRAGVFVRAEKHVWGISVPAAHGARAAVLRIKRDRAPIGAWLDALDARAPKNVVVVAMANKLARIAWAAMTRIRSLSELTRCRQLRVEVADNMTFPELSCLRDSRDSQITHYRSALRTARLVSAPSRKCFHWA